jgi:hypothetical protein
MGPIDIDGLMKTMTVLPASEQDGRPLEQAIEARALSGINRIREV